MQAALRAATQSGFAKKRFREFGRRGFISSIRFWIRLWPTERTGAALRAAWTRIGSKIIQNVAPGASWVV
jgi:hypothetical protein